MVSLYSAPETESFVSSNTTMPSHVSLSLHAVYVVVSSHATFPLRISRIPSAFGRLPTTSEIKYCSGNTTETYGPCAFVPVVYETVPTFSTFLLNEPLGHARCLFLLPYTVLSTEGYGVCASSATDIVMDCSNASLVTVTSSGLYKPKLSNA